MGADREGVCPAGLAAVLDNRIRRWLQDPQKIVGPYVKPGMTVVDLGCGPGFFTLAMARLVGASGRVIAVDLQERMLEKLRDKIAGTELEQRITLHRCQEDEIGLSQQVDFVLAFYMVHEVSNQSTLFKEIGSLLRPGGRVLVVEPPVHVSRAAFSESVRYAQLAGLTVAARPRLPFNKTVLLEHA